MMLMHANNIKCLQCTSTAAIFFESSTGTRLCYRQEHSRSTCCLPAAAAFHMLSVSSSLPHADTMLCRRP